MRPETRPTDTRPEVVRALSQHALHDLVRIRAELEGVSRMIAHAHIRSGSCPAVYRRGDLYASLALAGDAVNGSVSQIARFLDIQVVALHDPLTTLATLDDELGVDRDDDMPSEDVDVEES